MPNSHRLKLRQIPGNQKRAKLWLARLVAPPDTPVLQPVWRGFRPMGLVVAIQMDPIESVNIDGDSTFVLALEAQARGHALYHYLPKRLSLKDGRVTAKGQRLEVRRERGRHFTLGPLETIELAAVDVILMRQDPPFDMGYITATHVLEHLRETTLVVNDPVSVRNAPEKLFATHFPGLMPPTLVSS